MTTLVAPSGAWSGRYDGVGWEHPSLQDRFWDSLIIPSSEPINIRDSLCSIEEPAFDRVFLQTPEIFARSGANPVINVKAFRSPKDLQDDQRTADLLSPLSKKHASAPLPSQRWTSFEPAHSSLAPHITFQPATPSNPLYAFTEVPEKPKLAIPKRQNTHKTGISSPGSALLALASSFLSSIVRIGRSQPSSPAARRKGDGVLIVDSEILVSVVDDAIRTAPVGDMDYPGPSRELANRLRELDQIESSWDPLSTEGHAGSAEELDVLAKISWERQLMNVQGTLWH
jgi:hypothetical protein